MSVTGKRGVGIPLILMHDAEGTIVTIETQNGDSYRGFLDEAEDDMNCIRYVFRPVRALSTSHSLHCA